MNSTSDKLALAAHVSQRVDILQLTLAETSAVNKLAFGQQPPAKGTAQCNMQVQTTINDAKEKIMVATTFVLHAFDSEASLEAFFLRIEAKFHVTYALNKGDLLTQDQIAAFGEMNGVYNAWPYWREYIQSVSARMGLPPITINVFRLPEANDQKTAPQSEPAPCDSAPGEKIDSKSGTL